MELDKILNVEKKSENNLLEEYLKSYHIENMEIPKFLDILLKEWEESEQYKDMITGKMYFQNKNDIKDKKRYKITKTGGRIEDKRLNNSKESHSFMRKLTKQKSQYILGKPYTIETENDNYTELLEFYFGKQFKKMLKNIVEESVQCGIAWLQVYYDGEGNLNFKRIPSEQLLPIWRDIDHTILDAMVRNYTEKRYVDGEIKKIKRMEFYIGPKVLKYSQEDTGEWKEDEDSGKEHFSLTIPSVTVSESGEEIIQKTEDGQIMYEEVPLSWERVPFVSFKYNSDEMSLIRSIKSLIDDYDKISSMATDTIIDIPDSIKIVRNYDGQDLGELAENIYNYRMVKVSEDGDLTTLENKFDIGPVSQHLDRLRGDIYDQGQGVDTQNENTGDKSGVTLKFLYSDLDLDCQGLITEFKVGLEELKFFVDVDLQFRGEGDYFGVDADFIFNTDGIINEKEVIESIKNSADLLPEEYLIRQHPYVDDYTKVLEIIEDEKRKNQEMAEKMFGNFGNTTKENKVKEKEETEEQETE